jgi:hypothetical protein
LERYIEKTNQKEILIGNHRLQLGDDKILYFTGIGEYNNDSAHEIMMAGLMLANMVEGKVNVFINHNMAGKPTSEARKTFIEMTEHEKFGKIAHWGLHPVAKVLAQFVIGISRKKDMRFFKTKEEAIAWLKK